MATAGRQTVAPGEIVASDWGNTVWDHTVQCFDTAADRDGQFPSPQPGAVAYQADIAQWFRYAAAFGWVPLNPQAGLVAVTITAADTPTTLAVTFPVTYPAGATIAVSVAIRNPGLSAGTENMFAWAGTVTNAGFQVTVKRSVVRSPTYVTWIAQLTV